MSARRVLLIDAVRGPHEVIIDVGDETTFGEVIAQVNRLGFHSSPARVGGRVIAMDECVGDLALHDGESVVLGDVPAEQPSEAGLYLVAVTGPEAGGCWKLPASGAVTIGRDARCEIVIPDLLLSGSHARLSISVDGVVVVEDLKSTNGTLLEGATLTAPTRLATDAYLQLGSSVLSTVMVGPEDIAATASFEGRLHFPRRFREAFEPLPRSVRAPRAPADASASFSSSWWRSLIPIATGVAFAVTTGRWIFLFIAALAPLVYTFDSLRQRRHRKRSTGAELAAYKRDFAAFSDRVSTLRAEERRRNRDRALTGGIAAAFSTVRHRRLWERSPEDDDFGAAVVGLAEQPTEVVVDDDSSRGSSERALQWATPVSVPLLTTGSLAVLGAPARGRAVIRAMLVNLAATHSPSDLRISILGDAREWQFARWLPHCIDVDGSVRIAAHPEQRARMMTQLKQMLEGRAEAPASDKTFPLPLHIVVFDGAQIVDSSEMTALLARGPRLGIIGLTIDPVRVPEGCSGTLTIRDAADEAVFESRFHPRITGVSTAQMSVAWAEHAARRMAPLRPTARGAGGTERSARLTELLDDVSSDEAIARSWERRSPSTTVVVGTAASDALFRVDLVHQGPHALIGGTTRSGKTEFLKTLIASLCVANHPDDLALVIIDFKGGVDYTTISQLPHVLEVTSNRDIDRFRRTVELLEAEHRRRQLEFTNAHVANLDAYRVGRASAPDRIPIPRLVVIVDEFSELLANETGRQYLSQLESITRIGAGLGIHLVLVTQNFENQLPSQIAANAGMRICFRVQHASHSKIVLDSAAAASIPANRQGSAFVRLQGGDLMEFQSARVAGRRSEFEAGEGGASVRMAPADNFDPVGARGVDVDVPASQQDLAVLMDRIGKAAARTGWTHPAIPWPSALAADIALESVAVEARSHPERFPVGMKDEPEEQRQTTFSLPRRDQHTLLVGGANARMQDALTTLACSAALSNTPDELHLYGIDVQGRGLLRLAAMPHCGGIASRNEALASRMMRHITQLAVTRKAEFVAVGASDVHEYRRRTGRSIPHVLVLVANADRVLPRPEEPASVLYAPLASLITEAEGAGIQLVLSGGPSLAFQRPGSGVDHRIVFQVADGQEAVALGVARAHVADLSVPRRAVDVSSGHLVQFCTLTGGALPEDDVLDAFVARMREQYPVNSFTPPMQFREVHWPVRWDQIVATPPPAGYAVPLTLCVDATTGEQLWIDGPEDGPTFAVAGGAKSGRSTALLTAAASARASGWQVIALALSNRSPLVDAHDLIDAWCTPAQLADVLERIRPEDPVLVVVDDVHRLDGEVAGARPVAIPHRCVVLLAGSVDFFSGPMRSLANIGLPRPRNGLLLQPTRPSDGEAVGLSRSALPNELLASPQPGRGVIALAGEAQPITVPLPPR